MNKWVYLTALGAATCLIAAAVLIGRASRRDVDDIYGMLKRYE